MKTSWMHWNSAKASQVQYPTNHLTENKHRAVMQPGHHVNRFHPHLLKLLTHLSLNILSSKKFSEMFYFKKSQRKTSLHFKYLI